MPKHVGRKQRDDFFNLTFMGPCIVRIFQYISNKMQRYTIYYMYIWKLRYMSPNDGWWYHPKQVEQFPDIINCVTMHLVGYILEDFFNLSFMSR